MSAPDRPLRVVQWTTGNVARQAIASIVERPDLELVGIYAFSKDKVGQDAGHLAGLGRNLGVAITDDVQALIDLRPDCVVYMPLHPDIEHLTRLLTAGINVATTAGFITGRAYGESARAALEEAACGGNASLFGSGINPGWAEYLATVASGPCREVHHLLITESFNIGLWASDANQDELGWGRPADDPGHAETVQQATAVFGDAAESMAHQLGVTLRDIRCGVQFAHATADAEVTTNSPSAVARSCSGCGNSVDGSAHHAATRSTTPPWPTAHSGSTISSLNIEVYRSQAVAPDAVRKPDGGPMSSR
jgi:2,4-diaminopentanoate dehydrogenase